MAIGDHINAPIKVYLHLNLHVLLTPIPHSARICGRRVYTVMKESCRRKSKKQIGEEMVKDRSAANEGTDRVLGCAPVFGGGYKSLRG